MALETGTYIADLVATNPLSSDAVGQGDDHLRLIKTVLLNSLPNLGGRFARNISCSAGYTVLSTDNTGRLHVPVATAATLTHTVSLPSVSSITAGFFLDLHIPGASDVAILTPIGGASIEGAATMRIGPQAGGRVFYDGATWRLHQYPIFSAGGYGTILPGTLHVDGTTSFSSTVVMDGLLDLQVGQIKFPSTQNASADANTLDDYEEGTWTPVISAATVGNLNVTYSAQAGSYTKIGRDVTAYFQIVASSVTHTTASGQIKITGLPFMPGTNSESTLRASLLSLDSLSHTSVSGACDNSATEILIRANGLFNNDEAPVTIDASHTSGNGLVFIGQLTYRV